MLDEQTAHTKLDAVSFVRRYAHLPERLGNHAEHGTSIELLAPRLDRMDGEGADL
jgi:hypothetical protein